MLGAPAAQAYAGRALVAVGAEMPVGGSSVQAPLKDRIVINVLAATPKARPTGPRQGARKARHTNARPNKEALRDLAK